MNNKKIGLNEENKAQIVFMAVLAILAIVVGMVVGCGKDPGGGEVTETAVETESYNLIETSGNAVTKTVSEDTVSEDFLPLSRPFDTAEERMAQIKPDFRINDPDAIKINPVTFEKERILSDNYCTNCTYLIEDYAEYSPDFYEIKEYEPYDDDLIFTGTLYELLNPDGTPCYDKVFFPCDKEEWEKLGYTVNVTEDCVVVFNHWPTPWDYKDVDSCKEAVGTCVDGINDHGGVMEYDEGDCVPEPGMYGSLMVYPLHYAVYGCHPSLGYDKLSDEERMTIWKEEVDRMNNPIGLGTPHVATQDNGFTQYLLKDQIPADKELADNIVHE